MPIEGKSFGDQIPADIDFYGRNCDYTDFEMGWLLLIILEGLLKENYKLSVLN